MLRLGNLDGRALCLFELSLLKLNNNNNDNNNNDNNNKSTIKLKPLLHVTCGEFEIKYK